ncbi:MAG TPA: hypothetical protein EYP64_00885, partial [Desulfarculaceae bacterium]|nr:hypothetical protein [Desulfarculaceae bacterium]
MKIFPPLNPLLSWICDSKSAPLTPAFSKVICPTISRNSDRFGADYLRYFLLREVPFGEDGNFSPSLLAKRVNSDLANDLGNLLNRTLPLVIKYCQGKVPSPRGQAPDDVK